MPDAQCGPACVSPHPWNFLAGPGRVARFLSRSICVTGVGSLSNCDNEEDGGVLIPSHFFESTNPSQPPGP